MSQVSAVLGTITKKIKYLLLRRPNAAAFLDRKKEENKMNEDLALTAGQQEELTNNRAEKVEE